MALRYPTDDQRDKDRRRSAGMVNSSMLLYALRGTLNVSPDLPIEIATGRHDATGLALLTLAQEVWALKDQQMVTEALLRDKGLLGEIDRFQPDEALAAALATERARFVRAITTILSTGKPVD